MTPALASKTRRAFLFVLFTPVLLGIIVALEMQAYKESVNLVRHTNSVIAAMHYVLLGITRAESAQRAFLLSRDESYAARFSIASADVSKQMQLVRSLTADNTDQQKRIRHLQIAAAERLNILQNLIEQRRRAPFSEVESGSVLSRGTAKMLEISTVSREITDVEDALLQKRVRVENNTEIAVAASFAACTLINVAVLVWAYRLIVQYSREQELSAEHILTMNSELEQRVLERTSELELANVNLLRSNDDLTKFAYVASHDLQEPLRTIASYVGLLSLRYQGKLDDQADKYIKFVIDGAKRMQNLVQDLLIYARAGTESLRLGPVTMGSVLNTVRENLSLLMNEQSACVISDALPTLIGDESKLTQIFMNLVTNAIKFRRPDEPPKIYIATEHTGRDWLFSVRDNGIGFDQQYADRIFAVFQRLHGVGAYPGTGIGLAICKRIVEQHQGRIWATSTPGRGSCFWFTLPAELKACDDSRVDLSSGVTE